VTLRPAGPEDCRLLWLWRNDPTTRAVSFRTASIPWEEHERWFLDRLGAADTRILIVLDARGERVGYVRFQLEGTDARISVGIAPGHRGRGYGSTAIRLGADLLLSSGETRRILALIKGSNPSSQRAFERAGFARGGLRQVDGEKVLEMVCVR
jgi:RimJ/RimL family protein N-acetyltransferase